MKRVAHFIDSDDPGGAETLVIEMCRQLKIEGYETEIWHFGNRWLEEKGKEQGITLVAAPAREFYRSKRTIPVFTIAMAGFMAKRKIDLLHSHLFASVTGACFASFLTRTPHVGTLHDTYTLVGRRDRVRLLRMARSMGTKLVAVSRQMKEYLETTGNFQEGDITVIPNGVSLERFSGERNPEIRQRLGINPDELVLISVGRLVDIKGFDTLIEAMGIIHAAGHPVKLLIAGDGSEREKYEKMISGFGLGGVVILLGQRDDIPDLLKISDCFILASRSEGLSVSIIEAMAAGLPVVATDVGGNSELVQDRFSGYLVPPENPALLAEKLADLVVNIERRREFAGFSREIACRDYSLQSMIGKYRALYESFD